MQEATPAHTSPVYVPKEKRDHLLNVMKSNGFREGYHFTIFGTILPKDTHITFLFPHELFCILDVLIESAYGYIMPQPFCDEEVDHLIEVIPLVSSFHHNGWDSLETLLILNDSSLETTSYWLSSVNSIKKFLSEWGIHDCSQTERIDV